MKRAADVLYSVVGLRFLLASALLIFEHATKPADFIVASVFFGAQEHLVETIGLVITSNRLPLKSDIS
jgi:hypothetical protein